MTNYLSHFLLTNLLLPKLKESEEARVINVSAQAHYVSDIFFDDFNLETDFNSNKAFGQSKLSLVLMARHMTKLLEGKYRALEQTFFSILNQIQNLSRYKRHNQCDASWNRPRHQTHEIFSSEWFKNNETGCRPLGMASHENTGAGRSDYHLLSGCHGTFQNVRKILQVMSQI